MMVARLGQQSGLETNAFSKLMPFSCSTERVLGMYLRSSLRISSASMKTMLGLAVSPSASRAALPQTPDTSSTAKATATDSVTVLLMSNTPSWRGGREKGDLTPATNRATRAAYHLRGRKHISPKSVMPGPFLVP